MVKPAMATVMYRTWARPSHPNMGKIVCRAVTMATAKRLIDLAEREEIRAVVVVRGVVRGVRTDWVTVNLFADASRIVRYIDNVRGVR